MPWKPFIITARTIQNKKPRSTPVYGTCRQVAPSRGASRIKHRRLDRNGQDNKVDHRKVLGYLFAFSLLVAAAAREPIPKRIGSGFGSGFGAADTETSIRPRRWDRRPFPFFFSSFYLLPGVYRSDSEPAQQTENPRSATGTATFGTSRTRAYNAEIDTSPLLKRTRPRHSRSRQS